MACSKYILTNTGSTITNFSYRRCDDSMWDYQVELLPNQTKNIWVIDGTYTVAPSFKNSISLVDQGPFPPISATNTPTPSNTQTPSPTITPTETPTNTPTPSVTATQTPTQTQTSTPTNTSTSTPTNTTTPTQTPTQTNTQTPSNTPTETPPNTPTPSVTATETSTPTPTNTPTQTTTPTNTETPTVTPTTTPTNTTTQTVTPSITGTPATTPTATRTYQSYDYAISSGDLALATGNTGAFSAFNANVVAVVTNGYNCGDTTPRNFTYGFDSPGSYISWLISPIGSVPVLGYYQDNTLITVGLGSTQTPNLSVPC